MISNETDLDVQIKECLHFLTEDQKMALLVFVQSFAATAWEGDDFQMSQPVAEDPGKK